MLNCFCGLTHKTFWPLGFSYRVFGIVRTLLEGTQHNVNLYYVDGKNHSCIIINMVVNVGNVIVVRNIFV